LDIFPPPLSPLLINFCFFLVHFFPTRRRLHGQLSVTMQIWASTKAGFDDCNQPRAATSAYTRTQTNPFADEGSSCVLLRVLRFAGPAARHDFPGRRYKGLAKIWTSSHVHDRAIPRLSPSTTTPTSQFREAHHSPGTQEQTIQDLIR
jgi:hypothetical protein